MDVAARFSISFALIACCCGPRLVAQDVDAVADLPIELVVYPEKFVVQAGRQVSLNVQLTWKGKEPVTIYWGRRETANWVRLKITSPTGMVRETIHNFPPLNPSGAAEAEIVRLRPGSSATRRFVVGSPAHVLDGSQEFWFREPGPYELLASLEIYGVSGDPAQPDSWKALGSVTAKPVGFLIEPGDEPDVELRPVHGRVTDADGQPVPHADVYLHLETTMWSTPNMQRGFITYDRAATDENGEYAFSGIPADEPRLMLAVLHRALPPAQKAVAPDPSKPDAQVDVQMDRVRTVIGKVVDTEDRPLSGVAVSRPWLPNRLSLEAARTDSGGRFELHGITTSAATISVHKQGWEVVDDSDAIVPGRGTTTATIILRPLPPRVAKTVKGIARYENGEPARNRELTLWTESAHGDLRSFDGQTDDEGRFAVELSPYEKGNSGIVELFESREQDAQDRWMASFEAAVGEEINVEFRREHSLTVELVSANRLPAELTVTTTVSARPSDGSRPIASQASPGDRLTPLNVQNLTPGRYQVHVSLKEADHYNWYEDVVISPDEDQREHTLTIDIPRVQFGSLKVAVEFPDDSPQNDITTVWMDGHKAHGWQHIVNGVATFPIIPTGRVTVQCSERSGFVGLPIRGQIEADRETTLGPITIQPVEEAYGHVFGHVLLADGTPALGSAVSLQSHISPSVSVGPHFERTLVDRSGAFRVSAAPGQTYLVANLNRCDHWPPGSVVEKAEPTSTFGGISIDLMNSSNRVRVLAKPVTLNAGREQSLDFILPDVQFRDVTVNIPGEINPTVTLWTDHGDSWMQMQVPPDGTDHHVFPNVPDLPTRLFVSASVPSDQYYPNHPIAGVVDVPGGEAPVVSCDFSQTGTLRVRLVSPDDRLLSCRVLPADTGLPTGLAWLTGFSGESFARSTDEDGFVTFRLTPGEYMVKAIANRAAQERRFEIKLDEVEEMEFHFTDGTE
ncbi:MAG: carboxypeptidase regulatory-like domain-containing protein [Planctomycetaceae bacterium]|nr:carboxypeptidase regulatory-like domain-containing protein [Planctomycetaceae bacterium]